MNMEDRVHALEVENRALFAALVELRDGFVMTLLNIEELPQKYRESSRYPWDVVFANNEYNLKGGE